MRKEESVRNVMQCVIKGACFKRIEGEREINGFTYLRPQEERRETLSQGSSKEKKVEQKKRAVKEHLSKGINDKCYLILTPLCGWLKRPLGFGEENKTLRSLFNGSKHNDT